MEHLRSILPESLNDEQYAEKRESVRRSKKSRVAKFVVNLLRGAESRRLKEKDEKSPKWKKLVHFLFPPFVVGHQEGESSYAQPQTQEKSSINDVIKNTTIVDTDTSSMENVLSIAENTVNDKEIISTRLYKSVEAPEDHTKLDMYVDEKSTDTVKLEPIEERVNSIEKSIENVREDILLEQKNIISQKLEVLQTRLDVAKKKIFEEPNIDQYIEPLTSNNTQPNKTEEKAGSVVVHNEAYRSVRAVQIEHAPETSNEARGNKPSEPISKSVENELRNALETAEKLTNEIRVWLNDGAEFDRANEAEVGSSFYSVEIAQQEIEKIERLIDNVENDLENVNKKRKTRKEADTNGDVVAIAHTTSKTGANSIYISDVPVRDSGGVEGCILCVFKN